MLAIVIESDALMMFKSQATFAIQFMCKHTELKHAFFPSYGYYKGLKQQK